MTEPAEFYEALKEAGLEHSVMSWSGFNVFGDHKSIEEARRLLNLAGTVPELRMLLKKIDLGESTAPARSKVLCTYGPPTERKARFILKFDDADVRDMHFDDQGDAIAAYLRHTGSWTCTLFGTVEISEDLYRSDPFRRRTKEDAM